MPKNVTVQVGDELAEKMSKLKDANWSQVIRSCLERYCNIRLNPNIEALVQKVKEQKESAYSDGYKMALEWFKQEIVGYEDLDEISRNRDKASADFDKFIEEKYGDYVTALESGADPNDLWAIEERKFWTKIIENILETLPIDYDITSAFVDGFRAAVEKLEKLV